MGIPAWHHAPKRTAPDLHFLLWIRKGSDETHHVSAFAGVNFFSSTVSKTKLKKK